MLCIKFIRANKYVYKHFINIISVPSTPDIDVLKCSRSASSVVLVLSPHVKEEDVIDGYQVYYCSDQQKSLREQVSYRASPSLLLVIMINLKH